MPDTEDLNQAAFGLVVVSTKNNKQQERPPLEPRAPLRMVSGRPIISNQMHGLLDLA